MYTVTEILRLHILGAGGRANGNSYYGRWRFNNRGMFSDLDDPCVELRKRVRRFLIFLHQNFYTSGCLIKSPCSHY